MERELRILLLEDVPTDAEIIEDNLRESGVAFSARRVETREDFIRALEDFAPDVVLADYKLPAFDGRSAVQLVRQTHPQVPVIMVTGALGDEAAVDLLKAGARDYVLKDRLARLGPALRRALSEEQGIRARKQAEREVKDSESRFRSLIEHASDLVVVLDVNGTITYISPSISQLGGYEIDEVLGKNYIGFTHPEDTPAAVAQYAKIIRDPSVLHKTEFRFRNKDGTWTILESMARNALADPAINGIVINSRDVTERKRAEEELKAQAQQLARSNEELTRFNRFAAGRELRMIELKQEVNDLAAKLGQPRPYALAFMDATAAQIVRSTPKSAETQSLSELSQASNRKEQSP